MTDSTIGLTMRTEAQATLPKPQSTEIPAARATPEVAQKEENRQPDRQATRPLREQISIDELTEMLHKLNLTFDLFEIEAEFSFDQVDNQVRVVVRNTRTNEVIRRIPAHEFQLQFSSFRDGVGLLVDSFL